MTYRWWHRVGVLAVVAGTLTGCGGGTDTQPTGTVSGTLTKADGKPVTKGTINFTMPEKGAAASAPLNDQGQFEFEQPLPVGTYRVYLSAAFAEAPTPDKPAPTPELPDVPRKYLDEPTTDLTAEVKEGENTLPLKLNP